MDRASTIVTDKPVISGFDVGLLDYYCSSRCYLAYESILIVAKDCPCKSKSLVYLDRSFLLIRGSFVKTRPRTFILFGDIE